MQHNIMMQNSSSGFVLSHPKQSFSFFKSGRGCHSLCVLSILIYDLLDRTNLALVQNKPLLKCKCEVKGTRSTTTLPLLLCKTWHEGVQCCYWVSAIFMFRCCWLVVNFCNPSGGSADRKRTLDQPAFHWLSLATNKRTVFTFRPPLSV
jgi:hypothetical protein